MRPFFRERCSALLACGCLAAGAGQARAFYWGSWPGSQVRVGAAVTLDATGAAGTGTSGTGTSQGGGVTGHVDPVVGTAGSGSGNGTSTGAAGTGTGSGSETGTGGPGGTGGGIPLVSGAPEPPGGVPEPATIVSGLIALGLAGAWRHRRVK